MITGFKQTKTSSCTTEYTVTDDVHGKVKLRLWIIVGGIPALGFADNSMEQRYSVVEKYLDWDGKRRCYPHQDPRSPQGPTPEDLPDGIASVQAFLDLNVPKRALRDERFALLPETVISGRLHLKEWRQYFRVVWESRRNCVTAPFVRGSERSGLEGPPDSTTLIHIPEEWRRLIDEVKELRTRHGWSLNWEDLSVEEFESLRTLLATL